MLTAMPANPVPSARHRTVWSGGRTGTLHVPLVRGSSSIRRPRQYVSLTCRRGSGPPRQAPIPAPVPPDRHLHLLTGLFAADPRCDIGVVRHRCAVDFGDHIPELHATLQEASPNDTGHIM